LFAALRSGTDAGVDGRSGCGWSRRSTMFLTLWMDACHVDRRWSAAPPLVVVFDCRWSMLVPPLLVIVDGRRGHLLPPRYRRSWMGSATSFRRLWMVGTTSASSSSIVGGRCPPPPPPPRCCRSWMLGAGTSPLVGCHHSPTPHPYERGGALGGARWLPLSVPGGEQTKLGARRR